VFEGINIFLCICIRRCEGIKATYFNISFKLTNFIALLLGSTDQTTIVTHKQFVIKQAGSLFILLNFTIIIEIYFQLAVFHKLRPLNVLHSISNQFHYSHFQFWTSPLALHSHVLTWSLSQDSYINIYKFVMNTKRSTILNTFRPIRHVTFLWFCRN